MAERVWLACICANAQCTRIIPMRQIQPHEMDENGEVDLPLQALQAQCRECGYVAVYSTKQTWLIRQEDEEAAP
jgi:hypothetical protein